MASLDRRFRLSSGQPGGRRLDQLEPLADTEKSFEVVGGRVVFKRLPVYEAVTANRLLAAVHPFVGSARSDFVGFGMLYDMRGVENFRRPTLSMVRGLASPASLRDAGEAWSVVPEWVCEFPHPDEPVATIGAKVEDYRNAGVESIWVVDARAEEVRVYLPSGVARVLTRADDLTGGPLIPGFRLPLADLFPLAEPAS